MKITKSFRKNHQLQAGATDVLLVALGAGFDGASSLKTLRKIAAIARATGGGL